MKRLQRCLMVVLVGAGVALGPGSLAGWARPNPPFDGHDHGHDKGKEWKHHGKHEHWDNGKHKGWYKDRRGYYRFDDDDRRAFVAYYRNHEDEDEDGGSFREPAPRGVIVRYGYIVEPRYREYCHPVPVTMLEELPPPPPSYRYFIFGGNVVLVDNGYRVQDFISLNFNFGR